MLSILTELGPRGRFGLLFTFDGRNTANEKSQKDRLKACLFCSYTLARIAASAREERQKMPSLTKRELEVLRLVAAAQTNESIAKELGITERTVRFHLRNIYAKMKTSVLVGRKETEQ